MAQDVFGEWLCCWCDTQKQHVFSALFLSSCSQVMSSALEGEEYIPPRKQDYKMAAWVRSCMLDMAKDIGEALVLRRVCALWLKFTSQ